MNGDNIMWVLITLIGTVGFVTGEVMIEVIRRRR